MKKHILVASALAGMMLTTAISSGYAADFTVNTGITDATSKMLSANNDIGTIQSGATLSTSASPAIIAGALNQRINNAGTIETTNTGNPAIMFAGNTSTGTIITNGGIIRTTGGGAAHAIQITPSAPGITITNTGTIFASGTGNAVRFFADNNTLSNSGTIGTAGTDAIYVNGNNNRITLNPGTSLTGGISFAGGTGNVLEYSMGQSCPAQGGLCTTGLKVAPTITAGTLGVEYTQMIHNINGNVQLLPNSQLVTNGQQSAVVSAPTLMAVKTQKIIGLLGAITAEAATSMGLQAQGPENGASGVSTGNKYTPQGQWWLEGYGSYRERPQHSDQSYSESHNGGIVGGYNFPKADDGTHYGVYVSAFTGTTDLGKPAFRTIDSNGGLIGGMLEKAMGAYNVGGHLVAGFASNDSDRIVGGGVAKADYNDYFVSPRVTVSRPFASQSGYVWTPSVTAGYVFSYAESFTESGSLANQSVDSTTNHAIMGRAQMELALPRQDLAKSGMLNTSVRAGVEGMTGIGDQDITARVLGNSVTITPDTERSLDAILGFKFDLDVTNTVQLYLDGEAAIGLNNGGISDNKGGTARAGLKWSF